MTVTDESTAAVTEAEAQLGRLQERAADLMRQALAPATVVIARAAMNEAGIVRARRRLPEAHDVFATAQIELRAKQELERNAKEACEAAAADAEWQLDDRFVTEGNKTFLVTAGATPDDEPTRKAMTADERAKWKQQEARKLPAVRKAADALRKAEAETGAARDAKDLAERSIGACRTDLEAAIAIVGLFAHAITIEKETKS